MRDQKQFRQNKAEKLCTISAETHRNGYTKIYAQVYIFHMSKISTSGEIIYISEESEEKGYAKIHIFH